MHDPERLHAHAQSRDVYRHDPIHGNSAPVQRVDHHDYGNKNTATIALILSGGAVIGLIVAAILIPALIGAIVDKSNAEVRASVQQQIAQAQATAQAGKEHARIALDEVQRSNAQLEAKGLIRPATH